MQRFYWLILLVLIGGGVIAHNRSTHSQPVIENVDAILTTFDEQGQSRTLAIKDVQLDPDDRAQEIYLYTVLHQGNNGQWHNLCLPDVKGVAKALPLAGRWNHTGAHIDDDNITFACTNGALAKCVRWGYKPWKTIQGESLRDYHQACTRLVRADYCGDGISHTQEGTSIDVYDRLGLQQRTQQSGMTFEAAWDANGAIQLNHTRFPDTIETLQQACPEKLSASLPAEATNRQTLGKYLKPILFNDSFVPLEIP